MIIVTSYDSPDIDGIACSIAYSELLNRIGRKSKPTHYGDLGLEVNFVKKYTKYFPVEKHIGKYPEDSEFVLVDTADPSAIEPAIPIEKVVEIFDHRQITYENKFPNLKKVKIEQVGSCATLITEEFQKRKIIPSKNSAIYLYSAIISNTINFKNSVTTQKDKKAASWLKSIGNIQKYYVKEMFDAKSIVDKNNLYKILFQDFAVKTINGKIFGIAQIEISNLETKLNLLKPHLINACKKLKKDNNVDYFFFTGIDIYKGYNIFMTLEKDEETLDFFRKALGIKDLTSFYKNKGIIMRKQLGPLIENVFKNNLAG